MERSLSCEAAAANGKASGSAGNPFDDFDAIVEQHRPRIFRFIAASLRNGETAENLTQDCLIQAYRARDQFRGDSSVGTWLMQIAMNLVRNHEASAGLNFGGAVCVRTLI